jgi:DNA primase catalytic core
MARIPELELERLRRDVSLEKLVRASGVELRRHGADLLGLCPFHDDHEPSLVVSPSKNLWHCMGACQTGGSVVDWVMKSERVSFREAVEILRRGSPPVAPGTSPAKSPTPRKPTPLVEPTAEDHALLEHVIAHYHLSLKQSPEALAYLERRGIRSAEAIDHFRLGFANRTVGYHLPAKSREAGSVIRGRLQRLGILRQSGHEHFRGSLVIPIFDEDGQVAGIYGRKIRDDLRPGTPAHLYLPGPHRSLFNLDALRTEKEIILCEALIDALTFWCAGYRNVTSSYGVEGFTADHLAAFKRYGTKRVLIAYDRDDAGDKAAASLGEKLSREGIECFRVEFPHGMDANDYAQKVQPAEKSLGVVLRQAVWMGTGDGPRLELGSLVTSAQNAASETAPPRAAKGGSETIDAAERATEKRFPPLAASLRACASATAPGCDARAMGTAPSPVLRAPTSTPAQAGEPLVEPSGEDILVSFEDRRYRVRGLGRNQGRDQLRVNLRCTRAHGERFFIDTLDLYSARQRGVFIKQAAAELDVEEQIVKQDLAKLVAKLEGLAAELARTPSTKDTAPPMTEADKAEALALLRDPKLLDRILIDFERCGLAGEETSKLVGYLAAVSRKLEEPLAIIIQSSSAAGKTALMEAILAFMPEEERVKYSAMTGQSLFYMGQTDLRRKILAVVEETGAQRASYALKLLQSEGELSIASTTKDPITGRLVTYEYRVEGPVMILLATTAADIDEELLNRCIVLSVSENREQTRAIHRLQRESQTLEGLLRRRDREQVLRVHRNAQRLLRPLLVANPFARELTFVDTRTRTRRDHMKYLTLIRSIALLHQYQRPRRTVVHDGKEVSYIEVTLEDIGTANRLAHEVIGRSLDELAPQTRRLLMLLDEMVTEAEKRTARSDYRFTRREIREHTGWSYEQVRVHLERLVQLEYVLAHHGGRGQTFVYELVYDGKGKNGQPFVMGLLDVERLGPRGDESTIGTLGGSDTPLGVGLGGHTGAIGVSLGRPETEGKLKNEKALARSTADPAKNAYESGGAPSQMRRGRSEAFPSLAASAAAAGVAR